MKVILLYVSSIDGKVTKWGQKNIYEWTSAEDVAYFKETIRASTLLVMGSNTFNAVHPQPTEGILRIVLTHNPEKYKQYTVPGQLEFHTLSPKELVSKMTKLQHDQMILVSGKTISTEFLKDNLVDELWLTIEPKIFGSGDSMVTDEKLNISLQLIDINQLNKHGTLLVKYTVVQ